MINALSSGSGAYDATQIQLVRAKAADAFMQKVDGDQDGKITEAELSKAEATQDGAQNTSTADLFKQLDQGGKGYVTKQDVEAALAKADTAKQTAKASSATSGAGAPPAPGGGGGGGAAAAASSSTAAATAADPADSNGDGVVTMQEQQQYAAKLYEAQKETQTTQRQSIWQNPVYA